jgi:c-di-AMP phosphodiesterase-like protein
LLVCRADRDALEAVDDEIQTVHGDPTQPETLAGIDADVQSLLALDSDPEVTIGTLRAAETAIPQAFRMGYVGEEATGDDRTTVEAHADRVVDATAVLGGAISERVNEASARMRHLRRTIEAVDGELAIVTHDNPDPDAIASALALEGLAEHVGCQAEICYFGSISHQENRAFVNVLDIDMTNLDADSDLGRYGGFALVDHSRPGVNDQLPEDTPVDIVIDHHPPRGPVEADFADLRSHVGATSTLLVEYLQQSTLGIDRTVATALLFGIRIDTD